MDEHNIDRGDHLFYYHVNFGGEKRTSKIDEVGKFSVFCIK